MELVVDKHAEALLRKLKSQDSNLYLLNTFKARLEPFKIVELRETLFQGTFIAFAEIEKNGDIENLVMAALPSIGSGDKSSFLQIIAFATAQDYFIEAALKKLRMVCNDEHLKKIKIYIDDTQEMHKKALLRHGFISEYCIKTFSGHREQLSMRIGGEDYE